MIANTVVGMFLLAILGAAMGPQWDPVPVSDPLTPETSVTAVGGRVPRSSYPVRTSTVDVQLDGTTVQAQLSEPIGAPEPRPGVVFVHGAGTGTFETAFVAQARALAGSGVVTLVPDKRLDTYSLRHRNYVTMADDYAASVALLRARDGVDPDRVGVYAESEGAWIAPVMAARDPGIAFVVLVSAPVVPPRQQAAFATDSYLRHTGVPAQVFRAIPRAVGMQVPGGGFEYVDFDVASYQRQMSQPVFVAYGTADASIPMVQGTEQIIRDLALAGNDRYTVRFYPGADHGLRVDKVVSQRFLDDLADWVVGLPATAGAPPRIAGAQPVQEYWVLPVRTPGWLGDGDVLLALVGGMVGLILVGPLAWGVVAVVRRVAGMEPTSSLPTGAPRRLALLGASAIATEMALVVYLVLVARLAIGYQHNAVIVQGGWLGVRLLGAATVLALVVVVDHLRARRLRRQPTARDLLGRVILWGCLIGSTGQLVLLAYWGVFQLGI